ncbi:hypothetical protein HF288_10825 [Acidithiobacillus caldus]|uniref:hypothetical protein n=1 Tax=Acidithiobacillus caldus TaxID=33059 RepID=UPI001C076CA2|nr:hypothetical protein [Acidithiobacillus caldus]MBU2789856.1 hypothetical protein [Acidithiobacillus caldus]MBU2821801.1 hypothetical protein [Acidithiobacillus caldus]
MADETSQTPPPSGLSLVMKDARVAQEDLEAFIAWHERFRIDPQDPIFGLYLGVRASLTSALTATQGAIEATHAARRLPKQLKTAEEDLRRTVQQAGQNAQASLEQSAKLSCQNASKILEKSLAREVDKLLAAADEMHRQTLHLRDRVLDQATADLVGRISDAAEEALRRSTRRSRLLGFAATVVLLLAATAGV